MRNLVLAIGVVAIVLASIAGIHSPAQASDQHEDDLGFWVDYVPKHPNYKYWLGNQFFLNGVPQFCVNADLRVPAPDDPVVSVATISDPSVRVAGYAVTAAQMAWLLHKYQMSKAPLESAALSLLVHANFEQNRNDEDAHSEGPQMRANSVVRAVETNKPQIAQRAKEMIVQAQASGVLDYSSGTVDGEGARSGSVTGFDVKDGDERIVGASAQATLTGPAVWDETGTATISFKTANEPITKTWHATSNGDVSVSWDVQIKGNSIELIDRVGSQKTIKWQAQPINHTQPGPTWRVIFDFEPIGVSHTPVFAIDGSFTDTLAAQANKSYSDGQWLKRAEVDHADGDDSSALHSEKGVPVVYTAAAYRVASLDLPTQSASVPESAVKVGEVDVTAEGPSDISATFEANQPGWYVVVWRVERDKQAEKWAPYIKSGWNDGWALRDETLSVRYEAVVDTSLSIRVTKGGTYLIDDMWVTGLPANHTEFVGGMRFQADEPVFKQDLYFFPQGLEVSDANKDQAQSISSVDVEATNGFKASIGSTDFKILQDESGTLIPGTYVFVTSFKGDSRVEPFATSVADVTEQFVVAVEPSIHTTLLYDGTKNSIPPTGTHTLVDRVTYTNLIPGNTYQLSGQLMDKGTGEILYNSQQKPVTATTTFSPKEAHGSVDVTFVVDSSLYQGKSIVAFEKLVSDGVELVAHEDLTDSHQTLEVEEAPKLVTTASDTSDGDKVLRAQPQASITDLVCDERRQLKPGIGYEIVTSLMLDTGMPVVDAVGAPINVSTRFTPEKSDDCAVIHIDFDASNLAGKKVVVFEDILQDGISLAVHHDLTDINQTVSFEEPPTSEELPSTGTALPELIMLSGAITAAGGGSLMLSRRKRR